MIASLLRRLRRRRRDVARGPLEMVLHWTTTHALTDLAGQRVDATLWALAHGRVRRALADLADSGAFRYFEITSALELGDPPVALSMVDDGYPPWGRCVLEVDPVIRWIFAGGARGAGWRASTALTANDLA